MKSKSNKLQIHKGGLRRYMWFRRSFDQWFQNSDGIEHFANQIVTRVLYQMQETDEKHAFNQKEFETKQQSLKDRQKELAAQQPLSEHKETKVTMIRQLVRWTFWPLILTEAFLNFLGVSLLIKPENFLTYALTGLTAVVITLGATVFGKYFMSALEQVLKGTNTPRPKKVRQWIQQGWSTAAFAASLIAVAAVAWKRAVDIEGSTGVGFESFSLVLLAIAIPIGTAGIYWDREHWIDKLRGRKEMKHLDKQLTEVKEYIVEAQQPVDHKALVTDYYGFIDEFIVYKKNYDNKRQGEPDDNPLADFLADGHYACTIDSFIEEVYRLYNTQIVPASISVNGHHHTQPQLSQP